MMLRNLFLLILPLVLAGCSGGFNPDNWGFSSPDIDPNERSYAAATDPIALRIAESADKAATALQDLARVEQTRRPPAPENPMANAPDDMQQLVTIEWVGGAEALIRNLSARLNYDVVVVGAAPSVPVIVRINQQARPLVEALRSTGEQATEWLDLVVDPALRRIEIRYKIAEPTRS
jgi:hypothetical protein